MANKAFKTYEFPPTYKPGNLDQHKNDGSGKGIEVLKPTVSHHSSSPSITHGNTSSWSNYSRISSAGKRGDGWHNKNYKNGSIYTNWGTSGSKHTEIFRVGADSGYWWTIGSTYEHTGVGFEMVRIRKDSNENNNNAKQHAIFLKRWGVEFIKRDSGATKFWSSSVLNTDGNFNGGSVEGGHLTQYYFLQHYFQSSWSDKDYVVKALWFNTASQDTSKVGEAETDLHIYNMRFYHHMHQSDNTRNRWVRPAWRSLDNRNKLFLTE
jgi:hypothetical protein